MRILAAVSSALVCLAPVMAQVSEYEQKAAAIAEKAIGYLRAQQDEKTGGWSVPKDGPAYPAITALVLTGMLDQPGITANDKSVKAGAAYMLSFKQPDGGIYDKILPSYNTAIALSALAKLNTPEARAAIKPAQDFLKSLQFGEGALTEGAFKDETGRVGKEHPFYGGVGYGSGGRPDLSNTSFFVQGLHDSGVPGDDPAMQRALVFLKRVQMLEKAKDGTIINDMEYAKGSKQGGFVYATSLSKDQVGSGESKTGMIEETMDDGTKVSRLRAYGSMTYAGFKSLIYAQIPRSDPRIQAAMGWIRENYTLKENPGIGMEGMYYYFISFARALKAAGIDTVQPAEGTEHNWRRDLIDRLAELQEPDGSFRVLNQRWMEGNKTLITAYALIALQNAREPVRLPER